MQQEKFGRKDKVIIASVLIVIAVLMVMLGLMEVESDGQMLPEEAMTTTVMVQVGEEPPCDVATVWVV